MIEAKTFLVSIETEIKIISIEDDFEAKVAAMRIVQDRLNGSPINNLKFYVVDAENQEVYS